MSIVFADTFYWVALANRNDTSHQRATEFARRHTGKSLTTEWVLCEVADGLASARHRHLIQSLRTLWRTDERLTIVEASHELSERGLARIIHVFSRYCDNSFQSLTLRQSSKKQSALLAASR